VGVEAGAHALMAKPNKISTDKQFHFLILIEASSLLGCRLKIEG